MSMEASKCTASAINVHCYHYYHYYCYFYCQNGPGPARKEFVEDLKIFTTWFLLKFNSSISRAKNIGWHVDVNVNPNDCKCKCVLV